MILQLQKLQTIKKKAWGDVIFDAKEEIRFHFNQTFSGLNSKWFDNGNNVTYDVDMMQYKKL